MLAHGPPTGKAAWMDIRNRQQQLDALIAAWEEQQDAYVNKRADRFGIILDSLAYARPNFQTVLDIGGGLGSFSKLILQRFPEVRVLTLDHDPALLELARHNLREFAHRSTIIEADLRSPEWPRSLKGVAPDAVVSSTALHWLPNADLVALYGQLGAALSQGGLFFNADHLSHDVCGPFFRDVSVADDRQHQLSAFGAGVADWEGWWNALRAADGYADLVEERDRRFADPHEDVRPTPRLHIEALSGAGFAEAGTLWQYFDDFVVFAVR